MENSTQKVRHFERRAKIVATLGPATSTVEMLMEMIEAGMNVVRLNMSHGCHEDHAGYIANVRYVPVLGDQSLLYLGHLRPRRRCLQCAGAGASGMWPAMGRSGGRDPGRWQVFFERHLEFGPDHHGVGHGSVAINPVKNPVETWRA